MFISATINELTREIKWDKSQVAAVDGDYAVNGFKLTCLGLDPDYNLTTGTWYAVFTAQDGTSHSNPLTVSGGVVTWEFDNNINKGGAGVIKFFLYAVTANTTGKILKRWDSAITDLRVAGTIDYENQEEEAARESEIDRLAGLVTTLTATAATINDVKEVLSRITNSSPVVVAAVADLSGLDTTKYQLAIVRADGYLYYYDGAAWQQGIKYGSYELDTTLTESGKAADAAAVGAEVSAIKEDLSAHDARIAELEDGGSGGLSQTAVNLLNTILGEAVYGTDQTANIKLLYKELSNVKPVSITATLTSRALVGMRYSELTFEVTATFDDESTATVTDGYRVTTTGTVHSGANTVTVSYKGVTTNVTFEAEQVVTYAITYNLTDVTSSNNTTVVVDGAYYSTVLSVPTDYGFNGCTVTMGGVDITDTAFANMEILITEVTGDVVITASATEFIYLDDLLPTREGGFTILSGYPNGTTEDTQVLHGNYICAPFVSEYPALTDCTIHWKIKNISDSDVSLDVCGFGNINPDNTYGAGADAAVDAAVIRAFYCVKADNSSHILTPGAELEGDATVKSGMQLCFICKYADFSNFEIKLRGNYTPNTFDGYGEVNPTNSNTSAYGGYREVTYYKDNGSEELIKMSQAPRKIEVALEAGTYDMYYCVQATTITRNVRDTQAIVGGMSATTDTIINYAGGRKERLGAALWHHSAFTLSDSNMTFVLGGYIPAIDNTNATLRIMYKKVVSA